MKLQVLNRGLNIMLLHWFRQAIWD
jgi:hypothetical protein